MLENDAFSDVRNVTIARMTNEKYFVSLCTVEDVCIIKELLIKYKSNSPLCAVWKIEQAKNYLSALKCITQQMQLV